MMGPHWGILPEGFRELLEGLGMALKVSGIVSGRFEHRCEVSRIGLRVSVVAGVRRYKEELHPSEIDIGSGRSPGFSDSYFVS